MSSFRDDVIHDTFSRQDEIAGISSVRAVTSSATNSFDIVLDSGADISVFPEHFGHAGMESSGVGRNLQDAQGNAISISGVRKMDLELECSSQSGDVKHVVREQVVIGPVKHPLISFGRMIRQGWNLQRGDGQELWLVHPRGACVTASASVGRCACQMSSRRPSKVGTLWRAMAFHCAGCGARSSWMVLGIGLSCQRTCTR